MAEILSQKEIDALLSSAITDEAGGGDDAGADMGGEEAGDLEGGKTANVYDFKKKYNI